MLESWFKRLSRTFIDEMKKEADSKATLSSFRVDGDPIILDRPGYPAVPSTHSARNVDPNTFREVLIEFKR